MSDTSNTLLIWVTQIINERLWIENNLCSHIINLQCTFFFLVRPRVSLNPGPMNAVEGGNITLPICRETGHPRPDIKWLRPFGQLPQGRVQFENNNSTLTIFDVRRTDSDNYVCVASNLLGRAVKKTLLLVFSPPKFIFKPPEKIKAISGFRLKLNCSVTPDGHPVISWKRQGAQLPAGRSFITKEGLVITDLRLQDAGNYTCIATIAGKFSIETSTILEIKGDNKMAAPFDPLQNELLNQSIIEK